MCLISKTAIPSKSTYNIECYKVLKIENNKLFSPFVNYEYELGDLYINSEDSQFEEFAGHIMIQNGYYHSYRSKEAANICINELISYKRRIKSKIPTLKIFKAEIPANTNFYEGQYADLASKSLKIIEECLD